MHMPGDSRVKGHNLLLRLRELLCIRTCSAQLHFLQRPKPPARNRSRYYCAARADSTLRWHSGGPRGSDTEYRLPYTPFGSASKRC
eukprot:1427866-Rhodomonas_salina.5